MEVGALRLVFNMQSGDVVSNTKNLPICGFFDTQRFTQFSPEDAANWFLIENPRGKKGMAMYPTMGRRHINMFGSNQLIFGAESRGIFKSVSYGYNVVGNSIFRIDKNFNSLDITGGQVTTFSGPIWFTYIVTPSITYACFSDQQNIYIYQETPGVGIFNIVTDPNAPGNFTINSVKTLPGYIASFGNRIVVSALNTSQFSLSEINLGSYPFNPATCFTIAGSAVFAQEEGIIKQMAVIHNTLYIFTDFTTGIWSNTPSTFTSAGGTQTSFPWKKNSTYDWNYGMADPESLDVDFDRMTWLAQNSGGLTQVMTSSGAAPETIDTKAIDVLFQRNATESQLSPFIEFTADGFLYSWENTIFYRLSAGSYNDTQLLDIQSQANSIEYNFDTKTWHRCIELNGGRNRIKKHIYFQNIHLVSVDGESTLYEMAGDFYFNESRNPLQPDSQAIDAYIQYPFRYERITPIIAEPDDAEFITDFIQIDFNWGNGSVYSTSGFQNTQYIVAEANGSDGNPVFVVEESSAVPTDPVYLEAEQGNTPALNESFYNDLFKPQIELLWSDDGGVSFKTADVLQFSDQGIYEWRMRWYQLGCSRNRVYKLICISPYPIVIFGGVMAVRRVSGGAT
jgi:hypothetical protein